MQPAGLARLSDAQLDRYWEPLQARIDQHLASANRPPAYLIADEEAVLEEYQRRHDRTGHYDPLAGERTGGRPQGRAQA